MKGQFTLGRKERLKSRKQIDFLFNKGRSFSAFPFKVYFHFSSSEQQSGVTKPLQFGIGVGTRNFKKATVRNRVKRLAREAYRTQKSPLELVLTARNKQLTVFFIYTGKDVPEYLLLKEKTKLILERLIKMADENGVANT